MSGLGSLESKHNVGLHASHWHSPTPVQQAMLPAGAMLNISTCRGVPHAPPASPVGHAPVSILAESRVPLEGRLLLGSGPAHHHGTQLLGQGIAGDLQQPGNREEGRTKKVRWYMTPCVLQ